MLLSNLLFIGNLGTGEIIVLVLIVLLLFGAKRIPDLARGLGKGIREFKDATKEIKNDIENASTEDRYSNTQNRNNYNNGPGYTNPGPGYNNNAPYNNGNAPYTNTGTPENAPVNPTPHNPNV
ncbi:Sec-independent protein translocase subunit TatA/TatB [Rufibacter radiotolerans]|uniref:Sec-independent protein translocase subunit TatA/TatB n=1 Tax=Rufibacter radiotolerans TaxID=1379910 RepID=UPI0009E19F36|nr:twin-arginine translocase TatA/TatE family subunit [Rufibacter radiotolerans]